MSKTSNTPSQKRVFPPPPMRITDRDKQIILAIYRHRLLSAVQVEALLFHSNQPRGKRTVCQRRLQLLYHHHYLDRLRDYRTIGEGRLPLVYALDNRGADFVANELGIDRFNLAWKPNHNQIGSLFLKHTLTVNTVWIIFNLLTDSNLFEVKNWLDEANLKSRSMKEKVPYRYRGARKVFHYPDGYFCVQSAINKEQIAHFFLEVDMGTMTNKRWQDKVRAYLHFRHIGLAQKHFGTNNFRVLTVTTTARRLQNLKKATERVQGDDHFWFTTGDQLDIWKPRTILTKCWNVATAEQKHGLLPARTLENGNS